MKKIFKNYKSRIKNFVSNNKTEVVFLSSILLVGAVLRLWRIGEYMTFLGDEGRDAIIVRRFLVDFDLILIGPGTSIGNMYLGPLYYYFMAPFLLLANFNPAGPAVAIALLGVITIWFVWFVVREFWPGKKLHYPALTAAFLYAISPTIIIYSRSSWNPNIMPFFSLLAIYATWKFWKENKFTWIVVAAVALAFALQSHYLALILIPVVGLYWFSAARTTPKKKKKAFWKMSTIGAATFLFLMSPLVIFDARHGWLNYQSMAKFFLERQTTVSAKPWSALPKAWPILVETTTRLLGGRNVTAGALASVGLLVGFWYILFRSINKENRKELKPFYLILTWLGAAILGLGIYKQHIYDHYYGFFFTAPYIFLAGLVSEAIHRYKRVGILVWGVLLVVAAVIVYGNLANSPLLSTPNMQKQRAEAVAEKIIEEAGNKPFNVAVLAERNYEDGYQYFLEKENVPMVEIDSQVEESVTDQLFTVCELPHEECDPTHSAKAEVANFGWSEVEEEWKVSGVILYKLVHVDLDN